MVGQHNVIGKRLQPHAPAGGAATVGVRNVLEKRQLADHTFTMCNT